MDCLHEILPLEIVNTIQKYTSHQICDDKYFIYKRDMRIHTEYISHYTPGQMLEMFVCYFNQEFIPLAVEADIRSGLVTRLKNNDSQWSNSYRGQHLVVNYIYHVHHKVFPKGNKLEFHMAWMNVYAWLTKLVEQELKYSKFEKISVCYWNLPEVGAFLPDMTWSKPKLQKLLTDNGLKWYKSWNRKKLVKKWYQKKI